MQSKFGKSRTDGAQGSHSVTGRPRRLLQYLQPSNE